MTQTVFKVNLNRLALNRWLQLKQRGFFYCNMCGQTLHKPQLSGMDIIESIEMRIVKLSVYFKVTFKFKCLM